YRVRVNSGWFETEQVFIAVPAYVASGLVRSLDNQLADLLSRIGYNSSITMTLGYDRATFDHPIKGFGFLVPKRERRYLKACTWVNNKFNYRAADDRVLLRCFFGGDAMGVNDEALVQNAIEELRAIMGLRAKPVFSHVARWKDSMAQYTVGHAERLERIETRLKSLPGIALGGNAYHGIGVPDCIRSGKVAAQAIVEALSKTAALSPG
ncbi:MAG: protoporphyrinogen oxidase, partial [Acidobacteriaceae bacterium]|nr:protoporphyrinogen oxidase [Acidobacteriaceae bacterium]